MPPSVKEDLKTSIYSADGTSPSVVVKRNPEEDELPGLIDFLATELGLISLLEQETMNNFSPTGEWVWENYQEDVIECPTWMICNKPRQAGISQGFAAKAFSRGMLSKNNYNAIFTSFKKEEAVNKISYVRQLLDALPPQFKKKLIRDPMQLIEWENPNGTRVKIMSHAQRAIRGINGDVFLDELGFYSIADEIYESATPAVAMVRGTIDITSTPFGKGGKFYEILTDKMKYPEFQRYHLKWWNVRRYLKQQDDEFLAKAMIQAPLLSLEERVHAFGNSYLISQYRNSQSKESFMQEFEGHFVDEMAAFFNRALILSTMFPADGSGEIDDYSPKEEDFNIPIEQALAEDSVPIVAKYRGEQDVNGKEIKFRKYDSIEDLYAAIRRGDVSYRLFGGADVAGSGGHASHFTILEEIVLKGGKTLQIERFSLNRKGWKLEEQKLYYDDLLRKGYLRKIRIDRTGIGDHISEFLTDKYGSEIVEGVHMGGGNKKQEEHMVNLRMRMVNLDIALAMDIQTIEDLYSINRVISSTKSVSYKASEKKRHHADAAWAIAFASLAGTPYGSSPMAYTVNVPDEIKSPKAVNEFGQGLNNSAVDRYFQMQNSIYSGGSKDIVNFYNHSHPGRFITNHED
jgi:phage FluMu gp28-like protein